MYNYEFKNFKLIIFVGLFRDSSNFERYNDI